jgi:hypothetical protein
VHNTSGREVETIPKHAVVDEGQALEPHGEQYERGQYEGEQHEGEQHEGEERGGAQFQGDQLEAGQSKGTQFEDAAELQTTPHWSTPFATSSILHHHQTPKLRRRR